MSSVNGLSSSNNYNYTPPPPPPPPPPAPPATSASATPTTDSYGTASTASASPTPSSTTTSEPSLSSGQTQSVNGLVDAYTSPTSTTGSTASPAAAPTQTIGAASAGPNDPSITVSNSSTVPRYYSIAGGSGTDPENLNGQTFTLQPGESATVNPGAGFIGAITDSTTPGGAGSRNEVNFGQAGKTWYDTDLEYGNTNVTLGPSNGMAADDGRSSLVGNTLTPYTTHGAVAGQAETDADKQSDLGTHVVSTQQMTLTST